MKIIGKISVIVGAVALATVAIGGMSLYAMQQLDARADELDRSAQRAVVLGSLDVDVADVLKETRSLFISSDPETVKGHADEILRLLADIERQMTALDTLVDPSRRAQFDELTSAVTDFEAFRSETVRLAVEVGAFAALAQNSGSEAETLEARLETLVDAYIADVRKNFDELRAVRADFTRQMIVLVIASMVIGLLIAIALAMFIGTRSMSRPLTRASGALRAMADGNLSVTLDQDRANDEIGEIWSATDRLLVELRAAETLRSEQEAMKERAEAEKRAAMHALADQFDLDVSSVVRTVAAAVNQLEQSAGLMSSSADRIGQVVNLITDIAAQTNLLALNATIEAARAGEAGKGFAVVAMEVKSLAEQTSKATGDITAQISAVQTATGEVVKAIEDISGTIRRVDEISSAIAASVEEQGAATGEIAQNVSQAAQGTQEVSTNIIAVSSAANDTGRVSGEIVHAAADLNQQASTLRAQVDDFIARVRAA